MYPERYENLIEEIRLRRTGERTRDITVNSMNTPNKSIIHLPKADEVDKHVVWPVRFIYIFGSLIFFFLFISAYNKGYFTFRNYVYSSDKSPISFWFSLISYLTATIGLLWKAVLVKAKHNKPIKRD